MLTRTFQHIQGIGDKKELELWSRGIHTWEDFLAHKDHLTLGRASSSMIVQGIEASLEALETRDTDYFFRAFPSRHHWRLFPTFQDQICYLDIETTGSSYPGAYLTTIGIFDGVTPRAYVRGRDLEAFRQEIGRFKVLVTYNGKSFDAPWIEAEMGIRLPRAHIDLRYVLGGLGYKGGLKAAERLLGMGREGTLAQVDGWFAVLLWRHFERTRDPRALDTLIRYNLEDVVKLKPLLQTAYNLHLARTPFRDLPEIEVEPLCEVDVPIYQEVVDEIRRRAGWY